MTNLTLHPRAAPRNKIRVWLCVDGAQEQSSLASLQWKLNEVVVKPEILRPLSTSHKSGTVLLTGIFEISVDEDSGPFNRVSLTALGETSELRVKQAPQAIPKELNRPGFSGGHLV